jgi:hypothetical protein
MEEVERENAGFGSGVNGLKVGSREEPREDGGVAIVVVLVAVMVVVAEIV